LLSVAMIGYQEITSAHLISITLRIRVPNIVYVDTKYNLSTSRHQFCKKQRKTHINFGSGFCNTVFRWFDRTN